MRFPLLFLLCSALTNAVVDFTNSALYDIYDFHGVDEVHITKCDFGCLIFAATQGEGFVQYPEGLDPYAINLIITDNNNEANNIRLPKLAQQRDNYNRKIPLTITGQGNISVVNQNDQPDNSNAFWNIVLYVVEKTKAEEISYEIYDYYYIANKKVTPANEIVTILSAYPYRIQADPTTQSNSVTARLVGFDNAQDNNKDGCPYAYKTPDDPSFPGFSIMTDPGLFSLFIGKPNAIVLRLDEKYNSVRDFTDGFLTTPGWNGCTKPNSGGVQSFNDRNGIPNDLFILQDNYNRYKISLEVLPNFDATHYLSISNRDITIPTVVRGTTLQTYFFDYTNYVLFDYQGMRLNNGFLVRYSSKLVPQSTTSTLSTVSSTQTSSVTSPTQSPTTSSAFRAVGFTLSLLLISLLL